MQTLPLSFSDARMWCAGAVAVARLILQGFKPLGVQLGVHARGESRECRQEYRRAGSWESRLQVGGTPDWRRAGVGAAGER